MKMRLSYIVAAWVIALAAVSVGTSPASANGLTVKVNNPLGGAKAFRAISTNPLCYLNGNGISQSDVQNAINSGMPFRITQGGYYCLTSDIKISLPPNHFHTIPSGWAHRNDYSTIGAIHIGRLLSHEIQGPYGVFLDLNGHTIHNTHPAATVSTTAVSAYASANTTVTNGYIDNFSNGVYLWGDRLIQVPGGKRVDGIANIEFSGIADTAANLQSSFNKTVARNTMRDVANGVEVSWSGWSRISNNYIELSRESRHLNSPETVALHGQSGIYMVTSTGSVVESNRIVLADAPLNPQYGIISGGQINYGSTEIISNRISNIGDQIGLYSTYGQKNQISKNEFLVARTRCERPEEETAGKGLVAHDALGLDISYNVFSGPFNPEIELLGRSTGTVRENTFYYSSFAPVRNSSAVTIGYNRRLQNCEEMDPVAE